MILALCAPLVLLAAAADPAAAANRYDPEGLALFEAMGAAAAELQDYTMLLVKRELRGKSLEPEERLLVKWQRPQRIYLKQIVGPHEGQEVLYAPGWNKGKLKVHKGSFPDVNLNLDPYGTLAMSDSHHPIPEVSLVRFVERLQDNLTRARAKGVGTLKVTERGSVLGRAAVKVEMTTPPTGKTPTLAKGQTLWDVARETGQSMYVILHANRARHWTRPEHPEPGDAVLVPDFYASGLVLWIDEALHLPIQADLYDFGGNLYEHYEHRDLKLDVGLTAADFDPANPAYHF